MVGVADPVKGQMPLAFCVLKNLDPIRTPEGRTAEERTSPSAATTATLTDWVPRSIPTTRRMGTSCRASLPSVSAVVCIGSLNVDLVVRVARMPDTGETVTGHALERHLGGKGLNQALAARRAGGDVALVGAVGSDDGGTWMLRELGHVAEGVYSAHTVVQRARALGIDMPITAMVKATVRSGQASGGLRNFSKTADSPSPLARAAMASAIRVQIDMWSE